VVYFRVLEEGVARLATRSRKWATVRNSSLTTTAAVASHVRTQLAGAL
jgi:hypothetical protein